MKRIFAGILVALAVAALSTPAGAFNRAKRRVPGPPRVLLLGDSITVQYAPRAAELIGTGTEVDIYGAGGTGLLDQAACSGARALQLQALYDPDVVVIEYTGNYAQISATPAPACDVPVPYASKVFFARWKTSAKLMEKTFRARGAKVIWMQVPATATVQNVAIPKLNKIYRAVSKGLTVDVWAAWGGPVYNAGLHSDGIHLSPAGIEAMAQQVAASVRG